MTRTETIASRGSQRLIMHLLTCEALGCDWGMYLALVPQSVSAKLASLYEAGGSREGR